MSSCIISEPVDVTDLLGTDELIEHQNQRVAFTGMTVEPSTDPDGKEVAYLFNWDGSGAAGDDLYFNVSKDGETYSFTVESYLTGEDTDVYKAVQALEVGQVVNMTGYLYWYEGANPHIISVEVAE
jgi:tricorn protease-like protein